MESSACGKVRPKQNNQSECDEKEVNNSPIVSGGRNTSTFLNLRQFFATANFTPEKKHCLKLFRLNSSSTGNFF